MIEEVPQMLQWLLRGGAMGGAAAFLGLLGYNLYRLITLLK